MLVERINGGWCISDIINGYLVTRRYFGYTKRESMRLFKVSQYLNIRMEESKMCTKIQRNQGKFKGEGCITKAAWEWMMDGDGEEIGGCEGNNFNLLFKGPFSEDDKKGLCDECQHELNNATSVQLMGDENGFCYGKVVRQYSQYLI